MSKRPIQRAIGRHIFHCACCLVPSHFVQLSFGRMWRITLKLAGIYSSISETS
jgi:hypothetical protein